MLGEAPQRVRDQPAAQPLPPQLRRDREAVEVAAAAPHRQPDVAGQLAVPAVDQPDLALVRVAVVRHLGGAVPPEPREAAPLELERRAQVLGPVRSGRPSAGAWLAPDAEPLVLDDSVDRLEAELGPERVGALVLGRLSQDELAADLARRRNQSVDQLAAVAAGRELDHRGDLRSAP